MTKQDAEEYTQALGQVLGGGWRQVALGKKLGVPKALGLSVEDWVQQRLGGYVKLAVADRRDAVAELAADGLTQREVAEVLGVDAATVNRDLVANATADTDHLRENTNSVAASVANATAPQPLDAVASLAATDDVREAVERLKAKQQREERRKQIVDERPAPPMPVGTYAVLLADPPWRYEHVETENRAVENQYPTMSLDEICALAVPAADDAVLFLYATSPKLAEAIRVIDAWRFNYRTCAVWVKDRVGMGYYFRQQHELLLVAARGALPVPDPTVRPPSVIRAPRAARHSEKPGEVYALIERMYPAASKVELFARPPVRDGWAAWGNEN